MSQTALRKPAGEEEEPAGFLARFALSLTEWTERWVPDAFIFALIGTILVVGAALAVTPATTGQVIDAWGRGFWELIPFTLQMSLIIITGHVLATSGPMRRLIRLIAAWPQSPRSAVALVTFFALATSWINWGFSLVFSAVLALEVARRVRGVDYRALAAASFLGIGSIWAQGLSGSAALQMASPGALQPQIRDIVAERRARSRRDYPVPRHDLPLAEPRLGGRRDRRRHDGDVVRNAAGATARGRRPISGSRCRTKASAPEISWPGTPGTWLEHSSILTWLVVALGGTFLVRYFMAAPEPLNALTLNIINLSFLLVGMVLHRTPARLMRAVQDATPAVWGVILQFPFYAGIAGIITGTHLSQQLASAFVQISTRHDASPPSSRSIPRYWACSCRRADRSGSSRRRT